MTRLPPLLSTKLFFPPARAHLVSRQRLVERLQDGLQGPLSLISAPAGYGKTTLMSEWRAGVASDYSAAWLSLDNDDNDATRFLTYTIAALAGLKPGFGETTLALLQPSPPLPPHVILTSLINELGEFEETFSLILDDYHVITQQPVHEAITYLLDHLPSQMHLVIISRADPPLPLSRLRARDQLTEIRAADLRFTVEEAAAFLNQVMRLALSIEQVGALEQRTEGWVTGLQLAALSMQGRADVQNFVSTFTGSHHYIVDFLGDEVLNSQPKPSRDFLLQTSILSRLTAPLCDALTGRADGKAMLEELEHTNLFLVPLDDEQRWYRYHHLFADMLVDRLKQSWPDQVPALHSRASRWFEESSLIDEAIYHALAAQDWDRAATLMQAASQLAMRAGEMGKLIGWAKAIPEPVLLKHATLSLNCAWAFLLTGQPRQAELILNEIEAGVRSNPDQWVDWLAIEAYMARGKGDMGKAMALAHQALAIPETRSIESQSILALTLALTYWHMGKPVQAAPLAQRAAALAEQVGNWQVRSTMLSLFARIQALQGRLREAEKTYHQVTDGPPAAPDWSGSGIAQSGLSALCYEWNQLDRAAEYARQGLAFSHLTGHGEIEMSCHRLMARIHQAWGESDESVNDLAEALDAVHKHSLSGMMVDRTQAEAVQLALARGDLARAEEALTKIERPFGAAFHYPHIPLERAMFLIAQGKKAEAMSLLDERYRAAEAEQAEYAQIEVLIFQALAASDEIHALEFMTAALHRAEPEGYVRVFVDRGPKLAALLRSARSHGIAPIYVYRLLSEFDVVHAPGAVIPREQPLIEPLTERELEVLRLVAQGKSNQQIADTLFVATGTVKRHLSNMFGKIGVQSRTECVARARELNLL